MRLFHSELFRSGISVSVFRYFATLWYFPWSVFAIGSSIILDDCTFLLVLSQIRVSTNFLLTYLFHVYVIIMHGNPSFISTTYGLKICLYKVCLSPLLYDELFFFWNYCSFYHSHWIVYLIISPFGIFENLKTYNKHKNNAILKITICSILTTNIIIFWISKLVRIRVRYFSILPYSLINMLDWLF